MLLHITVIDTFPVIFKILTYFHLTYLWDVSISFIYLHTHYMIFYEPFKSIEYISPFLCMLCATWLPSLCICNYCYSANIHFISTIFHDFLTFHNNLLKYFPNRNLWNKPESKANHFFSMKRSKTCSGYLEYIHFGNMDYFISFPLGITCVES